MLGKKCLIKKKGYSLWDILGNSILIIKLSDKYMGQMDLNNNNLTK